MNLDAPTVELIKRSMGFQQACQSFAIFAAVELGILRLLDQATKASAADLATQLGSDPKGLELLLNCLVSTGILLSRDGEYRLQERFSGYFSAGGQVTEMLRDAQRQCRLWIDAAQAVGNARTTTDISGRFAQPEAWTSQYLRKVELKNRPDARILATRLRREFAGARTMIDIGGGHGQYANEVLAVNPDLHVVIYDLPGAISFCRENMRDEIDRGRITLEAGDARHLGHEGDFDIALLSDLLHYFKDDEKQAVLDRGVRSLSNGGLIVVSKFRLDSDGTSPGVSAFFSFQKYIETPNAGYLETDEHCAALLELAGAVDVEISALSDQKTLLTGRRRL